MGYALIGYFPLRHLGKEHLERILNGWITFVFASIADRDRVLNGGPYVVCGRTLLLKVLPAWFKFGAEELTTMPLWVAFPHLPLECWNAKLLSRIASK